MYESTILALGAMALLMFCQLIIADLIGIKDGHTPGGVIPANHDNLLFRASRTVANTNESIVIFVLATIFCIYSEASPAYTAYAAWGFVAARLVFACFYYANIKVLRSVTFGITLVCLLALLVIGFSA